MSRGRWGRLTGSPRLKGKTWTQRPMVIGCKNSIVASKMIFIGSPRLGCIRNGPGLIQKHAEDSPHRYPKRMVMKGCCSPRSWHFEVRCFVLAGMTWFVVVDRHVILINQPTHHAKICQVEMMVVTGS